MKKIIIVYIFCLLYNFIFANSYLQEVKPSFSYRKILFPENSNIKMMFNHKGNIYAIGYDNVYKKYFLYIVRNNLFKELYRGDSPIVAYSIAFDSSLYFIGKTKIFKFYSDTLVNIQLNYSNFQFRNIDKPIVIDSNLFYFAYNKGIYLYKKGIVKKIAKMKEITLIKYYVFIGQKIFFLSNTNKLFLINNEKLTFLSDSINNIWNRKNRLYIQKGDSIYRYDNKMEFIREIKHKRKFFKILPFNLEKDVYLGYDKLSLYLIREKEENIEKVLDISDFGFYIKSLFIDNKNSLHLCTNSGYYIFPYLCIRKFEFNYNITKLKDILKVNDKFIFVFFKNVFVVDDEKIFNLKLDLETTDIIRRSYLSKDFLYLITKESILIYDRVNFNIVKKISYNLREFYSFIFKDTVFFIDHNGNKNMFLDNNLFILKKLKKAHFPNTGKNVIEVTKNIYLINNFLKERGGGQRKILPDGYYIKKAKKFEIDDKEKNFLFLDNFFNLYLYIHDNLIKLEEIKASSKLFFYFDSLLLETINDQLIFYIEKSLYIYNLNRDTIVFQDSLLNCRKVISNNNEYYILKENKILKYKDNEIKIFFHTNEQILDFCLDDRFYVISNKYFYILNRRGDLYKKLEFAYVIRDYKFIDKNCFFNKSGICFYSKGEIWDFSSFISMNNSIAFITKIGDYYYIFTDFYILKISLSELSNFLFKPVFYIDSIFVDNEYIEYNGRGDLYLKAGTRDIIFKLSINSNKNDFKILTFWEEGNKVHVSNKDEVFLYKLKSGRYNFRFFVEGNNLFSIDNGLLNFKIYIDKYWWEKKEYILLLFFIISGSMFFLFLFIYRRRVERYKIESEINALSKMQREILKSGNDFIEEVEFQLFYSPYFNAGGDFYDIKKVDDSRIVFIVGDISGHGLNSSLITAQIKTILNIYKEKLVDAQFVLSKINNFLIKSYKYDYYSTLIYIIIDLEKYKVHICSAGHPFPVFFDSRKKDVFYIEGVNSFPLGMIPDYKAKEYIMEINPGDILCIYTDGIFDNYKKYGRNKLESDEFLSVCLSSYKQEDDLIRLKNKIILSIKEKYPKKNDDETLFFIKLK